MPGTAEVPTWDARRRKNGQIQLWNDLMLSFLYLIQWWNHLGTSLTYWKIGSWVKWELLSEEPRNIELLVGWGAISTLPSAVQCGDHSETFLVPGSAKRPPTVAKEPQAPKVLGYFRSSNTSTSTKSPSRKHQNSHKTRITTLQQKNIQKLLNSSIKSIDVQWFPMEISSKLRHFPWFSLELHGAPGHPLDLRPLLRPVVSELPEHLASRIPGVELSDPRVIMIVRTMVMMVVMIIVKMQ